jgi:hypothetical protein
VFGDGEETNHHNRDTSKEKGSKYHNLQNQTELKKPQTAGDEQNIQQSRTKGKKHSLSEQNQKSKNIGLNHNRTQPQQHRDDLRENNNIAAHQKKPKTLSVETISRTPLPLIQ